MPLCRLHLRHLLLRDVRIYTIISDGPRRNSLQTHYTRIPAGEPALLPVPGLAESSVAAPPGLADVGPVVAELVVPVASARSSTACIAVPGNKDAAGLPLPRVSVLAQSGGDLRGG